jgi:hypothetical protein
VGSNPDRVKDCGFRPWLGRGLWVQTLIGSGIVGSNPDRFKPKTIKFLFVASPLRTQH